VNVTVTVFDSYGRLISGLRKDNFLVFDDKVRQEISHFSDTDSPVSIGIVFDTSSSMKDRMRTAQQALKRFIDSSHQDDDFFMITFNDRPKLAKGFTTSADDLIAALQGTKPEGSTALYDAVYLALEKAQEGRQRKKAILIISDGQDNHSRYSERELRRRVNEADVQVYAIGLTDSFSDDLRATQYGKRVLAQIVYQTGGRAFFPNAYNENALIEACMRIAVELRHQYSVGFYPSDQSRTGRRHSLEIRLNAPKGVGLIHLSYRRGYQSN
jgi:Ca-activated chloride channel homolog